MRCLLPFAISSTVSAALADAFLGIGWTLIAFLAANTKPCSVVLTLSPFIMLPLHRSQGPTAESLAKIATQPFGKFLTRWVLLGCTVVVLLWFGGPIIGDILWAPPAGYDYLPPPPPHHPGYNRPQLSTEEEILWHSRRDEVREAFKHAWTGYKTRAFPSDELLPISGGKSNKYNGWSVTLFDSLDTMWIMGLREEFEEAVESVKDRHFNATKPDHYAPFFETTIRYLGGALSAYALSGEPTMARLADELGQLLIPAFEGTTSGLPAYSVNVETGKILADAGKNSVLFAEATSCQLEFKYLAKITGKKEYYERVQTAMDVFYNANVTDGLFNDNWLMKDGSPTGEHYTIGATADSGYEYLLKQWLLSGDVQARDQYLKSANGIMENLLYLTPNRNLMYVGDLVSGNIVHRLEHLSCFLPGLFALGAHTLDLPPAEKELHEWVAHGLAYTCAISYADQATGLGPDEMMMPVGRKWISEVAKWKDNGRVGTPPGMAEPPAEKEAPVRDYVNNWSNAYLLRPETVESIFYMWRTTGDVKWRERGYAIFQAIEKHAKANYGYSSLHGVDSSQVRQLDDMPSWFLAETLKYMYLLFDDTNSIILDNWVFNTEAHPLPVFSWSSAEIKKFNITT